MKVTPLNNTSTTMIVSEPESALPAPGEPEHDAVAIESMFSNALEYSCTCGNDEVSCRHCNAWGQAYSALSALGLYASVLRAANAELRARNEEMDARLRAAERDCKAAQELLSIHNLGGMTDYNDGPIKRALAAEERASSLARELETVRADGERYRYMREQISDDMQWYLLGRTVNTPEDFDRAVDEARAREAGKHE